MGKNSRPEAGSGGRQRVHLLALNRFLGRAPNQHKPHSTAEHPQRKGHHGNLLQQGGRRLHTERQQVLFGANLAGGGNIPHRLGREPSLEVFAVNGEDVFRRGGNVDIKAVLFEEENGDPGPADAGLNCQGCLIQEGFQTAAAEHRFIKAGYEGQAGQFLGELTVGADHILTEDFYLLILTALSAAKSPYHRQRTLIATCCQLISPAKNLHANIVRFRHWGRGA